MEAVQARKQRLISGALTDEEVRSARIEELKMLFTWVMKSTLAKFDGFFPFTLLSLSWVYSFRGYMAGFKCKPVQAQAPIFFFKNIQIIV